ncbi:MAG: LCP family protein [Microbacteriaceae bacterium]|nr:LCP family protein [Microbacteriaceae bacterium]
MTSSAGADRETFANPVRFPDLRAPALMSRRGWWLVVLNLLIPGSAQLLAGNRRLGRFGVVVTFSFWALGIIAATTAAVSRPIVVSLLANVVTLSVLQGVLVFLIVVWTLLTIDTLRLVQLVRIPIRMRAITAGLAIVALAATTMSAGYGATVAQVGRETLQQLFSGGHYREPTAGRYNILLLGGDAGPDRQGLRPDSISVLSVDATTGATAIIGIPRNFERATFAKGSALFGPFPRGYNCGDECLINYLYTYAQEHPDLYPESTAAGSDPGIEATRDAVSGVTGLVLHYFVLVDMQGFAQLIDSLGGITVTVPNRIAIAPITARKPYFWLNAGSQRMTGATALWYARSRYNTTDYERMARQRQVQEAMLTEFAPANVLGKFQDVAKAGAQVVKTDVPSAMLSQFIDLAAKAKTQPMTRLELVPGVVDTVYPKYPVIHALVQRAIGADGSANH